MYSKDRGTTWHLHNLARTNTTEAQVAEIEPGVLMLNMRDNRGRQPRRGHHPRFWARPGMNIRPAAVPCRNRFVWQASSTWTLKTTSRGKDLLIFSNPNTTKGRNHITIKVSTDGGMTWPLSNQVTLDEDESWGYSCLSMIDKGDSRHLLRIERRPYDFSSCQTDRSGQVVLHETHTLHIDKFIYRDIGCLCCQYPHVFHGRRKWHGTGKSFNMGNFCFPYGKLLFHRHGTTGRQ